MAEQCNKESCIKSLEIKKSTSDKPEQLFQFGHYFVKTEGFEKIVVSLNTLMGCLWEAMKTKKNFRMILEYDAEALNVNVDFFEEATASSLNDSLSENE